MATPGWYPDPEGGPRPRYWDGQAWTSTAPPRRSPWVFAALGLVAVALIVALIIWQPWTSLTATPTDTRTARPTGSQWNELEPSETPTADVEPDKGDVTECPEGDFESFHGPDGGWYRSTGMEFDGVDGWDDGGQYMVHFANDRAGQIDQVTDGWVAATAVGSLDTELYSGDPRTAATQVTDCLSTSYYYDWLDHVEEVENRSFATLDGVSGWLITSHFWNRPGAPVEGDQVVVLVLDPGIEGKLFIFHTQAPTGDEERLRQVEEALQSLRRQ